MLCTNALTVHHLLQTWLRLIQISDRKSQKSMGMFLSTVADIVAFFTDNNAVTLIIALHSTRTSVVIASPRVNSSYEGKRMDVVMDFSGPVNKKSNKLYFEYTGNPNVTNIMPKETLATLVAISSSYSNSRLSCVLLIVWQHIKSAES